MKKLVFLLFSVFAFLQLSSQTVKPLTGGTKTSLRGLSVVTDRIVWASGSGGMVARSVDAGESWKWFTVKGFEKTEFRDIEAFDSTTAIIMAIAEPAVILKTSDGGATWNEVYRNEQKGMFLDAMDFWNDKKGVVIGDPINGKFFMAETRDAGDSWIDVPIHMRPVADSGEACFASSGTNIRMISRKKSVLVSGGLASHIFTDRKIVLLPLLQGAESTGANSVALSGRKMIMVAGGDFNKRDSITANCFYSEDAGRTWTAPKVPPHGYRSCIENISDGVWVSCGLNGVDISTDNGRTFTLISAKSFHVCRKAKKGNAVFFAGGNGSVAKLLNF